MHQRDITMSTQNDISLYYITITQNITQCYVELMLRQLVILQCRLMYYAQFLHMSIT